MFVEGFCIFWSLSQLTKSKTTAAAESADFRLLKIKPKHPDSWRKSRIIMEEKNLDAALAFKQEGNDCYKKNEFDAAIDHYNKAINACPPHKWGNHIKIYLKKQFCLYFCLDWAICLWCTRIWRQPTKGNRIHTFMNFVSN